MTEDDRRAEGGRSASSALRPAQVAAAALAAVAAAFLGSRLGVYGTVLGAGLISAVTTVGSEVFVRSVDRTKAAARSRAVPPARRRGRGTTGSEGRADPDATVPTMTLPTDASVASGWRGVVSGGGRGPRSGRSGAAWWKRRAPVLVATSAVAFVIGILAVTGYEEATGRALSGDDGTSVGGLFRDPGPDRDPGSPGADHDGPGTGVDDGPDGPSGPDVRDGQDGAPEGDRDGSATPAPTSAPDSGAGDPGGSSDGTGTPTESDTPSPTPESSPTGEPEPTGGGDQPGADGSGQEADDPVGG